MKNKGLSILPILLLLLMACNGKVSKKTIENNVASQTESLSVPVFDADSSYSFIQSQLSFGPRVPNSKAHRDCGDYIVNKFKSYGVPVIEQLADLKAFDGTILKSRNIIATISPEKTNRIILCAHWDSRPFADHDPDITKRSTPILAANDGASGVAVLIELARVLQKNKPSIGIDLICFDAEDYGQPSDDSHPIMEDSWALGTQYWAKNFHTPNYSAKYGILLDMVGASDARFPKEAFSMKFAPNIVNKVWTIAQNAGYGNYFVNERGPYITDDHFYINTLAKIPCIDLIHLDNTTESGFTHSWHTINDNINVISKNTLKAVGETLLSVIYLEN